MLESVQGYYGKVLEGCRILDRGSGAGRNCYMLA